MNPVIVIPVYFQKSRFDGDRGILQTYDHATTLGARGELPRCLESLQGVTGVGQIVVLVACEESIASKAEDQVHAICQRFPKLHTAVFGREEVELVQQRISQMGLGTLYDEVGLESYGAIRNLGVVLAHVLGFDSVVFVDDDEVIDDPEFLVKAMYGLGKMTRNGVPILAKSGYYRNAEGSYRSSHKGSRGWPQADLFNQWIDHAMGSKRLSRSNHACGGCLALSEEAYKRVAFDPYISRGEDLDYLLNLRMYGSDMWFDNQWSLRHHPPKSTSEGMRFRQDVYRWTYEYRKVEFSRTQIDLLQLKPSSLEPYPGPFLDVSILKRLKSTARARMLTSNDRVAYGEALRVAGGEADLYAQNQCGKYFRLQLVWSETMSRLKGDAILRAALVRSVSQHSVEVKRLIQNQEVPSDFGEDKEAALGSSPTPAGHFDRAAHTIEEESRIAEEHRAAAALAASHAAETIAAVENGLAGLDEEESQQARYSFESDDAKTGFDPGLTSEIRLNLAD